MSADYVPDTEVDDAEDVAARIAAAAWSIASLRDGAEFRMILRGPVDVDTTRTVLAHLEDVLAAGERVVTLDVRGLLGTHDQVAGLLGKAQCHAADHSGLVVAVGMRPDPVPAIRTIPG